MYGADFVTLYPFHHANQSVYLHDEYYYFLQRSASITHANSVQKAIKNHCDFLDAWQDRYFFVEQHSEYHSALADTKKWVLVLGINLLRNIIVYPKYTSDEYFSEKAKQLRSFSLSKNDKLKVSLKIEFYLLKISPKAYKIFRLLYEMIINITNKLKITTNKRADNLGYGGGVWS